MKVLLKDNKYYIYYNIYISISERTDCSASGLNEVLKALNDLMSVLTKEPKATIQTGLWCAQGEISV